MAEVDFESFLPPYRGGRSPRWVSVDDALEAIPNAARVLIGTGVMIPTAFCAAMTASADRWTDLEIVLPYLVTRPPLFERAGRPFRFVSTQASKAYRHLWSTGTVAVLPSRYSDLAGLCVPEGPLPADVVVVQVSEPGPEGMVSLSMSVGVSVAAVRTAPLVIAVVNPNMPYTFGAGEIPVSEIDLLVRLTDALHVQEAAGPLDSVGTQIAEAAAGFVVDGSTIQFGVGALPDAILRALSGRSGLRVHSGLVSEACLDLYEAGVIEGPMIAAQVVPSPRLVEWVHRNPAVQLGPPAYTHGVGVLSTLDRFVSLNSTVEVALDGSVNSEMVNGERISGPGGAPDFGFGASIASGGRAVQALRSTAARGSVSRIVRRIEPPNPVTLPDYLADAIVTEHGIAEVRGMPLGGRRESAIAALAAPDHRAALLE